jgi:hypothetical protein
MPKGKGASLATGNSLPWLLKIREQLQNLFVYTTEGVFSSGQPERLREAIWVGAWGEEVQCIF